MRKSLVALSVLAASLPAAVNAADYTDGDIHKNDYKWSQFNLMYAFDELPSESSHDYLEMEFGGRSGIFDLYGYVDVFDLTTDPDSDKAGADKIFMKFAPRVSLDALTQTDLSFGPVQELYVATVLEWGGGKTGPGGFAAGVRGPNTQKIGLGSDVNVPWLGKIGLNLYGTYDSNKKDWNGYQISTNWFKPFYTLDNGSFVSYQGYIDYQFGMKEEYSSASNGGAMFNGIYWHSERYALGYGLKAYKDVYGIKDSDALKSTGFAHYISMTYKF
ncbi:outer membrane protein OmpK [Photobacterium sp. 1_MG-2023]|uniref:nucleoside-specific channel-forming Tsx family protein n=1 Tax=Photobacterium sp. 1_MG-2023 TaxID=3062646 RepID=UPI0026E27177|nr:outer membrane protein OmpK [Photobacterium sp. 1_MG-2023]MDO6705276.1 outer membrane protein OmpK [Photobacterium sp. 1_MG-2023]